MADRIDDGAVPALDPDGLGAQLDAAGWAATGPLLDAAACAALRASFDEDRLFRSTIDMARHGFGRGAYRYFADPLPAVVAALRRSLYAALVPTARRWRAALGEAGPELPDTHAAFRERCHAASQTRPTPLLLRYRPGDHNCLHQDLYGPLAFPFQVVILLSEPGRDFTGGELVLVEQRPRRQSRAEVVPLSRGEGAAFAVAHRPVQGARGAYRTALRHGVSTVRTGERLTLGVIFHDAA